MKLPRFLYVEKEPQEDSKKTTASGNQKLMKKQQNINKLRHETWCERSHTYIKSNLPEEPTIKLRMNVDILAYAKHRPPLKCTVQEKRMDSLVDNKQFDIVLKKSTADTGTQYFLLGADHHTRPKAECGGSFTVFDQS